MLKRSNCRSCRRAGVKLFLKGEKCNSPKCPFTRRSYAPGHLGAKVRMKRGSDYSIQLREKQKLRAIYNIGERQMANYYAEARKTKTGSGEILIQLIERRLDNTVFRAGFASSRDEARQMVSHGNVKVNSKKVKAPSYQIQLNDEISLSNMPKVFKERDNSPWISRKKGAIEAKVVSLPNKEEISDLINEQLIIEYYSR
jgi:small subunit ribosomal protein S4